MAKQFDLPVVRLVFVTNNGVRIIITSKPRSVLSSNRSDAKVIGADYSVIETSVTLPIFRGGFLAPTFTLDDSQSKNGFGHVSSVYWDKRQTEYILEALEESLIPLGAKRDFDSLVNAIHESRKQVLSAQPLEAL